MVLLRLRAEVGQQLGRAERVRHHDRNAQRRRRRRHLGDHGAVQRRAEPVPPVLLRHDQAEELAVLELLPHLRRQVAALPDLPVVHHLADLLDRAVQERLLVCGQSRVGLGQQPLSVGLAREQFALDPDRACVDGLLFRGRDDGQELHLLHQRHHGTGEQAADGRDDEDGRHDRERDYERDRRAEPYERHQAGGRPDPQRGAGEPERE